MTANPSERGFSGKAVLSGLLGVSSLFFCIVTGLPALVLGWLGLRQIYQSEGRVRGKPLAIAGMVLGGLATIALPVLLGVYGLVALYRESNRTHCQDRLRRIGLAIDLYQQEYGFFPLGTIQNDRLIPEQRLSWLAALLPYLSELPLHPNGSSEVREQATRKGRALYEKIDRTKTWDDTVNHAAVTTPVSWFICPAYHQRATPGTPCWTTYIGIAGLGPHAANLRRGASGVGFFGYDRRITPADVTRGLSETMTVTETAWDVGPWAAGGLATIRAVDPASQPYIGAGQPFGGIHQRGLNVLFADGRVEFKIAAIDPLLWEMQATVAP